MNAAQSKQPPGNTGRPGNTVNQDGVAVEQNSEIAHVRNSVQVEREGDSVVLRNGLKVERVKSPRRVGNELLEEGKNTDDLKRKKQFENSGSSVESSEIMDETQEISREETALVDGQNGSIQNSKGVSPSQKLLHDSNSNQNPHSRTSTESDGQVLTSTVPEKLSAVDELRLQYLIPDPADKRFVKDIKVYRAKLELYPVMKLK